MKRWQLSDYFTGVASKKLSAVEANLFRSNQHEYNGVQQLKNLFGLSEPKRFDTKFIWFGGENEGVTADGFATWYDARRAHPSRSEYRLFFSASNVSNLAKEGDAIFFCLRRDETLLVVITESDTTVYYQLLWLFGLSEQSVLDFDFREIARDGAEVDFAARYILDELGVEAEDQDVASLDAILSGFDSFPPTSVFSEIARNSVTDAAPIEEPDRTLLAWMEQEERLFRRLERFIVADRIRVGFSRDTDVDVDGFLHFSLSVQNRRKSRAGFALEHHLAAIFRAHEIRFDRGASTENRRKPDFLFPGITEYRDMAYSPDRLTMLGSKSTCKDRWRQVLDEADRITSKHLFTLEPGISRSQTDQMRGRNLQLVVPAALFQTYEPLQTQWLMDLKRFIGLVKSREHNASMQ